ncbi:unnamed protein product [Ostreobium quekettii]|uniref:ER membrane protein complex subunit 7 beta-sandwich domain-containing protein n=1 Tax=Ostreobium quekettii TaxID=121088 RepID=A0A8S1J1C4_9CHLO|nr:unnamed protein product [Ostreobium quekettii]|eukprot:evm.model.scf_1846.4 EVM.evm.TU.scf_1846.4   scf_1846:29919-32304(-)
MDAGRVALLLCLLRACLASELEQAPPEADLRSTSLYGRVQVPGPQGGSRYRDFRIVVHLDGGRRLTTFCHKDGSFAVQGLPAGLHTLDVYALGWFFPQVKVDVSVRSGTGNIRAEYADRRSKLAVPLVLPGNPVSYYDQRKPFNAWSLVKSPYGIMIGVMLVGIFIFPMLKVDPEDYKQMMSDLKGQQGQQQIASGRHKKD